MSKIIYYGVDARVKIKAGIDAVANCVKQTLGPKGRNVAIHSLFGPPLITNDGVTIAKHIFLKDEGESLGAELVKSVAWNANERAGDGTTTATLLAQSIATLGMEAVERGTSPMVLKVQLEDAAKIVSDNIRQLSRPVSSTEEIAKVGTISSQDPDVGRIISEIMGKLGNGCSIAVEEGLKPGLEYEIVEGYEIEHGFISPFMATDEERKETVFLNPYILITDQFITSPYELGPLVNEMVAAGEKDLLIICDNMDGQALVNAVVSRTKGLINICAVRAPGIGNNRDNVLADISSVVGAEYIASGKAMKLQDVKMIQLGRADKTVATTNFTRIIGGKGSTQDARLEQLGKDLLDADNEFDRTRLEERIQKMQGGIGVIKIGANSETELKEKLYRIEDAINATKYAAKEGIVPGGGLALHRASECLFDMTGGDNDGAEIIYIAASEPMSQIMKNCGKTKEEIDAMFETIDKKKKVSYGYDAQLDIMTDLVEKGIIDPTRVVLSSLENAVSVATTLLTIEGAIVEEQAPEKGLEDLKKDLMG